MKYTCTLLFVTITVLTVVGQKVGSTFPQSDTLFQVFEMATPTTPDPTPRTMDSKYYFRVIPGRTLNIDLNGTPVEHTLIYIPDNSSGTRAAVAAMSPITSADWGKYFWARTSDLSSRAPYYNTKSWPCGSQLSVSALTIPIIVRPKRGDLALNGGTDLNVSGSIGLRWRTSHRKDNFLQPLGFFGISTFKFTQTNNSGLEPDEEDQTGGGIILGGGLTYRQGSTDLGFFLGCDQAFGGMGKTYAYQGALWFGIGIGATLFHTKAASSDGQP